MQRRPRAAATPGTPSQLGELNPCPLPSFLMCLVGAEHNAKDAGTRARMQRAPSGEARGAQAWQAGAEAR